MKDSQSVSATTNRGEFLVLRTDVQICIWYGSKLVCHRKDFWDHASSGDVRTDRARFLYKSILVFTSIHNLGLNGDPRTLADGDIQLKEAMCFLHAIFTSHSVNQ